MSDAPSRRGPTIATLRAIEQLLATTPGPLSRYRIRQDLPTKISAPLLDEALRYLADHALIHDEGPGGKVMATPKRRATPAPAASPAAVPNATRRKRGSLARLVRKHRREILAVASKHGVARVRLFGSAARGEDDATSDVDLLIQMEPGRSLLDHIAFKQDVEDVLGTKVDVVSEGAISPYIREAVLREAVAV